MNRFYVLLASSFLLLAACAPSTEESLITFYEDEVEAEANESEEEQTDDSDNGSESEITDSSYDCTSHTDFNDQVLCQHNYIRAYGTDPEPDEPLEPLSWSTDLEDVARGYAEGCVYEHNADRSETISGYVGENIAATSWEATAVYVVNMWAEEVDYYDYDSNSCDDGEQCGHYTQIVWADTTSVGCAVNYCADLENVSWSSGAYFYVCNYSPGGNYVGQQPY